MVLRRTTQDLEANPLTRLPGNVSIERELKQRIARGDSLAVCYVDINRFKAFNDHYGFKRGDDAIRHTAKILLEVSRTHGGPNNFTGHIGGDDFILITTCERATAVSEAIIRQFDALAATLYDETDRKRGYTLHTDRQGKIKKLSFLSVAIAVVLLTLVVYLFRRKVYN